MEQQKNTTTQPHQEPCVPRRKKGRRIAALLAGLVCLGAAAYPAVQAQLQAAKAAAQARYEQEKQAQAINHSEEKAQQSRTWAAQK